MEATDLINAGKIVAMLAYVAVAAATVREIVRRLKQARMPDIDVSTSQSGNEIEIGIVITAPPQKRSWDTTTVLMAAIVIGLVMGLGALGFGRPGPVTAAATTLPPLIPTAVLFMIVRRDMKRTKQAMIRHLIQINQEGLDGSRNDASRPAAAATSES